MSRITKNPQRDLRLLRRVQKKYPSVPPSQYCISGCINIIGSIVRRAIQDAAAMNEKSGRNFYKRDGRKFLFEERNLEEFFQKYGIENLVNCAILRLQAQEVIDGRREINDLTELNREENA